MAPRVTQVRASPGKATEGADGVPGGPGRESGARWGQRCHQSRGQSVSKRMVPGFGRRAALRAVGGHRRSPLVAGRARIHGFGRVGGVRRGRREPVPGGLAAASMPRTPRLTPPTRPLTGSCAASHERQNKKSKSKAEAGRCALQCLISDVPWLPASGRHYRRACTHGVDLPQIAEICRRRGGSGGGGVRGMDAAAKPPGTGLRRPRHPDPPPPHGNPAFALAVAVAVALALAGAGRRPARALPPLPVQCRARFPTTVPRT